MYFSIERESSDHLTKVSYDFYVSDKVGFNQLTVKLHTVTTYKRNTRRHKYQRHEIWVRGWSPRSQRAHNQVDEFPGCPDDVRIEALAVMTSRTVYQFDPT